MVDEQEEKMDFAGRVTRNSDEETLTYKNANRYGKLPCLYPPVVHFPTPHNIADLKRSPSGFLHIVVVGGVLLLLPCTRASLPTIAESVGGSSF
jgi:hypothetical protein